MSRRPSPIVATAIAVLALSPVPAAAAAPKPSPKPTPKPIVALADPGTEGLTLAAGEGRILALQGMKPSGSRLLELVPGQPPRVIRSSPAGASPFSVGTDASGRTVAIANLCATSPRRGCDLSVIDVDTAATVPLPGSTSAYLADLDHGQAVLVRSAKKVGVRVSLRAAKPGGRAIAMPISKVAQRANGAGYSYAKTRQILSIDLKNGVLAASVWIDNDMSGYESLLIARGPKSGDWNLLAELSNGDGGDGNHFFGGPVVTPTGIRAFADWGLEDYSYVGRWSVSGKLLGKIDPMKFGLDGYTSDAVISGDTLVTAPVEFLGGDDGLDPIPVVAGGPFKVG